MNKEKGDDSMDVCLYEDRKILKIQDRRHYRPLDLFRACNAIWLHNRDPSQPHAILTSGKPGKHSDGYINCNQVLKFQNIIRILTKRLIERNKVVFGKRIDYVVSSSEAARPFGQELARQIEAVFVFTEKNDAGEQIWKRFKIPEEAVVLQAEELITTLSTTRKVRDAILQSNSHRNFKFLERDGKTKRDGKIIVVTLVHRPSTLPIEYHDYEVFPLLELEIHSWAPKDCPLCKEGSKALKPKTNWEKLTGKK